MERERGLDDKDICAQAMVAIIFFPLRYGTKTFPSEGVFWIASCKWEAYSAAFHSRGYHGLAR
jgi:hypothetical protein